MENLTQDNDFGLLEEVVEKAHKICNRILLCEAIDMDEDGVRLFLECNRVSDDEVQDKYVELVRKYKEIAS